MRRNYLLWAEMKYLVLVAVCLVGGFIGGTIWPAGSPITGLSVAYTLAIGILDGAIIFGWQGNS